MAHRLMTSRPLGCLQLDDVECYLLVKCHGRCNEIPFGWLHFLVCAALTSLQIEQENTQLTNDLYRLLKKYAGLRNIIRSLKVSEPTLVLVLASGWLRQIKRRAGARLSLRALSIRLITRKTSHSGDSGKERDPCELHAAVDRSLDSCSAFLSDTCTNQ